MFYLINSLVVELECVCKQSSLLQREVPEGGWVRLLFPKQLTKVNSPTFSTKNSKKHPPNLFPIQKLFYICATKKYSLQNTKSQPTNHNNQFATFKLQSTRLNFQYGKSIIQSARFIIQCGTSNIADGIFNIQSTTFNITGGRLNIQAAK